MDFTQLSNKELSEAIDFHRRQRNMSRGVNESAHMRQTQVVRLLEAEESHRLEEASEIHDKVHDIPSLQKHFDGRVAYDAASHSPAMMVRKANDGKKYHLINTGKGYHAKLAEEVDLEESEAAYKKADRDEKRKSGAGEYYVTNHDMKKTHSEPFKTSDEAISHANAQENKTGRIHTVHHIKNGKIQKQWQYSDSAGRFASYSDHAGQTTHIHEETDLDEAGAFSYGAKVPRKGSSAYNAMMMRKQQEKNQKPIEPKDQMIGNAKVTTKEEVELDEGHYHVSWSPNLSHTVMNAKSADHAVASAKAHLMKKIPKLADEKYSDTFEKKPRVTNITNESVMSFGSFRSKDSE